MYIYIELYIYNIYIYIRTEILKSADTRFSTTLQCSSLRFLRRLDSRQAHQWLSASCLKSPLQGLRRSKHFYCLSLLMRLDTNQSKWFAQVWPLFAHAHISVENVCVCARLIPRRDIDSAFTTDIFHTFTTMEVHTHFVPSIFPLSLRKKCGNASMPGTHPEEV